MRTIFGELKRKTVDLRNSVLETKNKYNNDEYEYHLLSITPKISKIIIENNMISFIDGEKTETYEIDSISSLQNIIHRFISKSYFSNSICGKYLVYSSYNNEHREVLSFINTMTESNKMGIISCDNGDYLNVLKDEFMSRFRFTSGMELVRKRNVN